MTTYHATQDMTVHVEALDRDVHLTKNQPLDDQFAEDKAVIDQWGPRGLVRADAKTATGKK